MKRIDDGGSWNSGLLSQFQISEALGEEPASLEGLLTSEIFDRLACERHDTPGRCFDLSAEMRASLVIAHALWRQAMLPARVAAKIVFSWPQIGASVSGLIEQRDGAGNSSDPFRFFDPDADEAIPVLAVDEYLDLMDGHFLLWRKPVAAPDGHGRTVDTRSEGIGHQRVWLGRVDGDTFLPMPPQTDYADRLPSSILDMPRATAPSLELSYSTKLSVNISLAARIMKRRALGLRVSFPSAMRPR
jgi:hypothetical protein